MISSRGTSRIVLLFAALALGLGLLANAQEAPDVIASGAIPYLITYGDTVTFWADVALPQSTDSVVAVWIVYYSIPLMALEEVGTTGTLTRWEGDWTLPDLPGVVFPGDYLLCAVAVSAAGAISEPEPFILSITDHDPRVPVLLSPRDGSAFYRGMPIIFEWSSVPEATGYNFEIVFPGAETVSVSLPFFFTSLVVQPQLAAMLPDGDYRWRVRAVFGDDPGDWAEYSMFSKNSQQGPPIECEGLVTYVDTNEGMLQVESAVWSQDGTDPKDGTTDPGYWGCWTVRVTDDTLITKEDEEITLADVMIGDYVFVEGWLEEDNAGVSRCPLVKADRIEVTDSSWPEYVSGSVDQIIPEERAFWVSEMIYGGNGAEQPPSYRVLVQLTDGAVLTRMGGTITFEDIQIGDLAVATGNWVRSGAAEGEYFLAESVDFSYGGSDWVSATGTIGRIDYYEGNIFVLSGTYSSGQNTATQDNIVVSVTRSTLISRNDQGASFGDLVIGDYAYVEGTLTKSDIKPQPAGGTSGEAMIKASLVNAYSAESARP